MLALSDWSFNFQITSEFDHLAISHTRRWLSVALLALTPKRARASKLSMLGSVGHVVDTTCRSMLPLQRGVRANYYLCTYSVAASTEVSLLAGILTLRTGMV